MTQDEKSNPTETLEGDEIKDAHNNQDQQSVKNGQTPDDSKETTEPETKDDSVEEEPEEEPEEMVEIPKSRLEELENAEAIALEELKRERAESINYRKRLQKQRDEFAELASVRVLTKVLAVKDDLRRVVENANGEIPETHMEGIQLVQQRLEGIFNQEGVELIKIEEGKTKYDPKLMEAVVSQPIPNVEPNIVMGVINQGFKKGDRVLRAAKVMISKAPEESKEKPSENQTEDKSATSEESEQTQESSTSDEPDKSETGEN